MKLGSQILCTTVMLCLGSIFVVLSGCYNPNPGSSSSSSNSPSISNNSSIASNSSYYTNIVTFDNQGGNPATNTLYVIFPAMIVSNLPSSPTKTGFIFSGWFTVKNGGGTQFTASTEIRSNITVYACWSNNPGYIVFSDYNWIIKQDENEVFGPGPNYFSAQTNDIWIDGNGYLHMNVKNRDLKWYSTEVITEQSFGYGTYVFYLGSRGDTLDQNIVLGLFTWDDNSNAQINYNNEIDFEFSRWNKPTNNNFQFVVQPSDLTISNIHRFNIDNSVDSLTVSYFTWNTNYIEFTSAYGSTFPAETTNIINNWTYFLAL